MHTPTLEQLYREELKRRTEDRASLEDQIIRLQTQNEAMKKALELILDDYTHGTWCPDSDELIPTIRRALALAEGKG